MYVPKVFNQRDIQSMVEFMRQNLLATFISSDADSGELNAEHLPLLVDFADDSNVVLRGHFAKSNPVWKSLNSEQDVLVIFQGSQSYISPNWYPSKKIDGKAVPTWNYSSVHAKGRVEFINEPQWILALLQELTDVHEKNQVEPWAVSDAPQAFVDSLIKAVVGVQIVVDEIIGKEKLSQNQSLENRQGVKSGLAEEAHEMSGLIDL